MKKDISSKYIRQLIPQDIFRALRQIAYKRQGRIYLAGGTVRDFFLQRKAMDIDFTVEKDAIGWAQDLRSLILPAAFVPLGKDEDAARIVWQKMDFDFSSLRDGARTIEEELTKRDITINSMGVLLNPLFADSSPMQLDVIDPTGGIDDLENKIIRMASAKSFKSDPLRMLRIFRFAACLHCTIEPDTEYSIVLNHEQIQSIATERITHELDLIMHSDRAHDAISGMAKTGLLWPIIPELQAGVGMDQPASHHLDVFEHSLAALYYMERIMASPDTYFGSYGVAIQSFIEQSQYRIFLKWAALLHDIGKPATYGINEDKNNRITFYNHDQQGAKIFSSIAERLKMSKEGKAIIFQLISHHMWPFHLNNVRRKENLSLKARLKIARATGDNLLGLFLLCMADSLAGQGDKKPEAMEQELVALLTEIKAVQKTHIKPVLDSPPLLTGNDLITYFHLQPGPPFKKILQGVQNAQIEKKIATREDALKWVTSLIASGSTEFEKSNEV